MNSTLGRCLLNLLPTVSMVLLLSPVLPLLSLSFSSLHPYLFPATLLFNSQNMKALIQQELTCMSNWTVLNSRINKEQVDDSCCLKKKKNKNKNLFKFCSASGLFHELWTDISEHIYMPVCGLILGQVSYTGRNKYNPLLVLHLLGCTYAELSHS